MYIDVMTRRGMCANAGPGNKAKQNSQKQKP